MDSIRLWVTLAGLVAFLGLGAAIYRHVDGAGFDRCEAGHAKVAAEAKDRDHNEYLAAVSWGNQVSTKLAETQRALTTERNRNDDYARSIVGSCPDGLRQLANAAALGLPVPEATSTKPDGPPYTVEASALGLSISGNYHACRGYIAQLNAWIDWCEHTVNCDPRQPLPTKGEN